MALTRPPLLWLHGLACRSSDVLNSLPVTGLGRPLLAPDLPGLSPQAARHPFDPVKLADKLVDVLVDDGVHHCHLLGHSAGFLVADTLIRRHPGFVTSLICLEGNLTSSDCFLTAQLANTGTDNCSPLIQALAQESDPVLKLWGANLQQMNSLILRQTAAEIVRLSSTDSALQTVRSKRGTVHYIHGGHRNLPTEILAADIPNTAIPDCGHFPYLEKPELFWPQLQRLIAFHDNHQE